MTALARWCYRHRRLVVLGWILLVVVLGGGSKVAGDAYNNSFSLPGTESMKAMNLIASAFPQHSGDTEQIVWKTSTGKVTDPAIETHMSQMLTEVASLPGIAGVVSPYTPAGSRQISQSGTIAYATVTLTKDSQQAPKAQVQKLVDTARGAATPTLEVEVGGPAVENLNQQPPANSEVIGLLAAGVILFLAFGSLFAMLLPLAVAILALASGISAIGLASHIITLPVISPTLAALIGLGVGIDYALFIVTRHRNNLKAGMDVEASVIRAVNTSGRAVLFAGTTVCIALLGLMVLRLSFLSGMGIGASIAVLFTVAAAETLLPALLAILGMRVLSRRERRRLAETGPEVEGASGGWARLADFVSRHPIVLATAATALMLVLAVPALSLRLGLSDAGNDPATTTTRHAYDLLAEGFGPGFNGPLELVAVSHGAADDAALTSLVTKLSTVPDVVAVVPSPAVPGAALRIITVVPASAPQDAATTTLISHLRSEVIPSATAGTTLQVYVGGATAVYQDFASVITSKLPLFIVVIVGLGFILLLIAFRSIVVPLTAALMNLLAAGAAFGVVVAVFQKGWGLSTLGLGKAGPIEAFLPVIMLSILFGLSMDYQVFLVSRMHEEWVRTKDNEVAVRTGQATTGRVITAAAAIMTCVFIAFVFGGQRVIAEFGVGLAAAVLLDAFVIRTVLVPAAMHWFGPANWWLPGWLDRIMPHLSVDPSDEDIEALEAEAVSV